MPIQFGFYTKVYILRYKAKHNMWSDLMLVFLQNLYRTTHFIEISKKYVKFNHLFQGLLQKKFLQKFNLLKYLFIFFSIPKKVEWFLTSKIPLELSLVSQEFTQELFQPIKDYINQPSIYDRNCFKTWFLNNQTMPYFSRFQEDLSRNGS